MFKYYLYQNPDMAGAFGFRSSFSKQLLGNYVAEGKQLHNTKLDNMFESDIRQVNPLNNDMDSMSINVGYLISLIRMIDEFSMVEISRQNYSTEVQYLQQLWRIVKSMYGLLTCKMKTETKNMFKKKIFYTSREMIKNVNQDNKGKYIDVGLAFDTEVYICEIFQDLINHMEQRGMLTYKKEDPRGAMGNFSD